LIRIYCENSTPRLEYIFHFILDVVCGFKYEISSNEQDYCSYSGPTLNYSLKTLKQGDIEIKPNGLLSLDTITACRGRIEQEGKKVRLYLKGSGLDETCFDLFSASFYLLTRYEEYLSYVPDIYNRFEARNSFLYEYDLIDRPLINEWAESLRQTILNTYNDIPFRKNRFRYKMSIDIDQVFAFRHRGVARNIISFLKNVLQRNMLFLRSQFNALATNKDPYDTFAYLKKISQEFDLPFIHFINVGTYSKYDKNVPVTNTFFKNVLHDITSYAEVGLHPSYFSNEIPYKFKEEKDVLEQTLQRQITKSRQHYLKLALPETYRCLLAVGITEDYSMGYGSYPGFRAGTCTPFQWFDLQKNISTPLMVFPVVYMENVFAKSLGLSPEQALRYMKRLTDIVRLHEGFHISIWHNHTVNDMLLWKGWKAVFEASIIYLTQRSC
jgi:hypothetical protein